MPMPLVDRLRGKPTEAESQREQTKELFNEITGLAPQVGHDYYVSSSLAQSLVSSSDSADFARIAADSLNLKETDLLYVSWDPNRSPGTLLIHNNGNGTRDFAIDFDRKTFKMEGVRIENKPFHSNDQSILNGLLESIRDDLARRRADWRDDLREQRDVFAEHLKEIDSTATETVESILDAIGYAKFPLGEFAVFGTIENQTEDAPPLIRLFSSLSIDEKAAKNIYNRLRSDSTGPRVKDAVYTNRLQDTHITLPTKNPHRIEKESLLLSYPNFNVSIENFTAISTWYDGTEPKYAGKNGRDITEQHFELSLAGREVGFYPIPAVEQNATLLLNWPSKIPDGTLLFDKDLSALGRIIPPPTDN